MSTNVMSISVLAVLATLFTFASTSLLHDKRIINGEEAEPLSHPYIVTLQLNLCKYKPEEPDCDAHFCGGVVIDMNWVLTAAHCLEVDLGKLGIFDIPKKWMQLKFGEHDLEEVSSFELSRGVQTYIKHHDWNRTDVLVNNDIALIRLDTPVELGGHIQAANLSKDDSDFVYETCVLAGWGKTEESNSSVVLKEVNITHIPNDVCVYMWKESLKELHNEDIDIDYLRDALDSKMFAFDISPGLQGQGSACIGDSGGPMVCGEDRNTLVGITSFGTHENCSWLSVYTRVSKYLTWIEAITSYVDSLEEK